MGDDLKRMAAFDLNSECLLSSLDLLKYQLYVEINAIIRTFLPGYKSILARK